MENSPSSSVNRHYIGGSSTAVSEESGWTAYLQDSFLSDQREQKSSSTTDDDDQSLDDSPSLRSDAASHAAAGRNKVSNDGGTLFATGAQVLPSSTPMSIIPQRLNFKNNKRANKELPYDDSLEDTASSPVNSPKVSNLKHVGIINPGKMHDHNIETSLGKKGSGSDSRNEMDFDEKNELCVDLKKKGLCLVPLSMLMNYL